MAKVNYIAARELLNTLLPLAENSFCEHESEVHAKNHDLLNCRNEQSAVVLHVKLCLPNNTQSCLTE